MAKNKIKISNKDAYTKIDQQINKGSILVEEGSKTFKRTLGKDKRIDDNFENRFNVWVNITIEILDSIFVSTEYNYEFKNKISSEKDYVSYDWKPDIRYWISKQLIPKIDYLIVLRENINEFEYEPQIEQAESNFHNGLTILDKGEEVKSHDRNMKENGKTGRTIWDMLHDYWKPIILGSIILFIIITILALNDQIRIGYNDGFYFELGSFVNADDSMMIGFTHSISIRNEEHDLHLRAFDFPLKDFHSDSISSKFTNAKEILKLHKGQKVYIINEFDTCYEIFVKIENIVYRGFISSDILLIPL